MKKNWLPFTQDFGTINAGTTGAFGFVIPGAIEFAWASVGWQYDTPTVMQSLGLIVQPVITDVDEVTLYITNPTAGNIVVNSLDLMIVMHVEE